ncbi:MAG: IS701 family transposase [Chloroflexi bacterium]|nr:IS701 family transposase [Chloroflexota bacterium]
METIATVMQTIPPPSGRPPEINLAPRDVAALADELADYHALFAPLFGRAEQRRGALCYLQGQLLDLERKTIEPLALALAGGNVQALQQFISQSPWDAEAVLRRHQEIVAATLGDVETGVLIVDGCDFPKQGPESVGVARQWCGASGKVANCQASVVACYASRHGYTLVDRRLYLPEKWFSPMYAERRARCGVPPEVAFRTKPQLAGEIVAAVRGRAVLPFRYVTGDEGFGANTALLDQLAAADLVYLAEVPHTTRVWTERPGAAAVEITAVEVGTLAAGLPAAAWTRHLIKEGAKGPLEADIARVRVRATRDGQPGPEVWVVLRRSLGDVPTLKAYLSNAPADTPLATLVWLCGMRWPVETSLLEAKGEVGLDHYEVRGWVGWHHHITLSFLAHHFLVRARLRLGKKSTGPDGAAGAPAAPSRAAASAARHPHGAASPVLHPAAELCRLSLAPRPHATPPRYVLAT